MYKNKSFRYFKDMFKFFLSVIIALNFISSDALITLAVPDQGHMNGYVNAGFTNKVNNPKYSEFENTDENINPVTGAVTLRQVDVSFSGRDGLDLELARTYNSGETDISRKKALYSSTEYYQCYELYWQYINGQWKQGEIIFRPKYTSLKSAQDNYQSAYDACVANSGFWQIKVFDNRFEAYGYADASGNYLVYQCYAPIYGYEEFKGNDLELKNYNVERYDLGTGWSFDFPSIEFAESGYMYFHNGSGGTYRMVSSSSNVYSLEKYDAKDITITSAIVGGSTKYYVDYSGQKKYTFNSDGTIEKISDRFGNRIKFDYITRPVYNKVWPSYSPTNKKAYISKITDSIGRVIDFTYENKIDSGENNTLDLLSIYVTDPLTSTRKKILEYEKRGIRNSCTANGVKIYEFNHPILEKVKKYKDDTNFDATRFIYDNRSINYDFWNKTAPAYTNLGVLLTKVVTNTYATNYVYENVLQNLGTDGSCYEARCKQRYDILHDRLYYDTTTNSWTWNTGNEQKLNVKDFEYSPMTYTGYPTYNDESSITDNTQLWSIEKDISGISTKTVHSINNSVKRMRLYKVVKTFPDNSYMHIVNDSFDSTFPSKPTVVDRSYFDKNGTFTGQGFYTYYTYTNWGAIESETKPIIFYKWNDDNYKNKRKITYEYESAYKLLKKKTWWQNDTTQLYEENTFGSLGRVSTNRNAKGEIQSYIYETTNGTYTGESTPFVAVTKCTQKKPLENNKEEKTEIYYDVNKGSLPVKTIVYFSDDSGSKQEVVTMAYDMLFGLLKTKTENGNITTYNYDLMGREKSIQYPGFTDIDGKLYEVTENYNYLPGYSYNDYYETSSESYNGIEYQGIYGLTVESEVVYKCNGVETKYNQSKCLFDAYGNLRSMKNYDPKTSRWIQTSKNIFDSTPRLIASIDANVNKVSCNYDIYGNMSEIIDAYGNMNVVEQVRTDFFAEYFVPASKIQAYRQDPHYTNANVKNVVESYFNASELLDKKVSYKSDNRQNPLEETFKYDITGNIIGYVDPKANVNEDNNTNTYYYDSLDRLVKVKNALNQIVDINYNLSGSIDSVYARENDAATAKSEIYKKNYSEDGKLTSKTVGSDNKSINSYNDLGLISTSKFKSLNMTNYYYDELKKTKKADIFDFNGQNLLQRISYLNNNPFGVSEIRTSDNIMTGTLNDKITFGYNYDAQMSSKQVDYSENGVSKTLLAINQKNDIGLNIKSTVTGFGNSYFTNYTYNKGRLEKVQLDGNDAVNTSDLANAKITYNDDGKIDNIQYPVCINGEYLKTKYLYNALSKVESVSSTLGSKVLLNENYEYDNNGNISKVIQTISSGSTTTTITTDYTYDKLNRLFTEKIQKGSTTTNKSYTYDLLGNRIQTPSTYIPALNEKEQVVSIPNISGTGTSSYKYGQDGLRYQKSTNSKVYNYSYDIDGNLSKINEGTTTDNFSWANGKVYAKKDGKTNNTYYYIYNGFGDVIQLVDSSGNIVNSYTYDAWGNLTSKQETVSNPFRYRGYIFDDETGMYYLKARYYDPSYGRFLTEDTFEGEVSNLQSLNTFIYCNNNPLAFTDSSGKKIDFWSGLGLVGGFLKGVIDEIRPPMPGELADMIEGIGSLVTAVTSGQFTMKELATIGLDMVFGDFIYLKENWNVIDKNAPVASFDEGFEFGVHAGAVLVKIGSFAAGGGLAIKAILTKLDNLKNIKIKSFVRGPGCFTAGTLVSTKDGYKPIEKIKAGDYVWAENPNTGEKGIKKVLKTSIREKYTLIHVYVNGTMIETTEEHPFWVIGKGWINAGELRTGDILSLKSGENSKVTNIKRIDLANPVKVYNFEVEDWHTYFVSKSQVLVHNGPCNEITKLDLSGSKAMSHLRKHAQHARETAMRMGLARPNSLEDVQKFLVTVINTGETRVGKWGGLDVTFSKLGDAVVIRQMNGQYLTNLDYSKGGSIIDNWAKAVAP